MTTFQPMHPGRIPYGFTHLVDETARRLQDPTDGNRHVLVQRRFALGSMETDDTLNFLSFVNQVGKIRRVLRRTPYHNDFRTLL